MTMRPNNSRRQRRLGLTGLLVLCCLVGAMVVMPNKGYAATSASDNFDRANGPLGPNWTNLTDGALTISNQMAMGTNANGNSGDVRTAETYANDQYSQITVTSTALTGSQWIGPMVRAQNAGSRPVRGHLLLEQRQPRPHAVQAHQRQLDPAGLDLRQRRPGRRHHPHPDRGRHHPDLRPKRGDPYHRQRHQPDLRVARHHGQRGRHRRQLDRRQRGGQLLHRRQPLRRCRAR